MFGGVGFRQQVRDVVGIYPTPHRGLILVHLCAPDLASGAWTVTEVRTVQQSWTIEQGAMLLTGIVHEELKRAGWTRYALCLALPPETVIVRVWELPLALSGTELREALLWSLRASTDGGALPEDAQIDYECTDAEEARGFDILLKKDGEVRVIPYAADAADRDTTLKAAQEYIAPAYAIRWYMGSLGSDTLAFVVLSAPQWEKLEREFGAEQVAYYFAPIDSDSQMFEMDVDDVFDLLEQRKQ